MDLHEFDKLRFRYEYGNESIQSLCAEYGYFIDEVEKYANERGWELQADPNILNIDKVNDYYADARRRLTVCNAKRALVIWDRLVEIEDTLLMKTFETLSSITTNDTEASALELNRLLKIITSIKASNKIYDEAVSTPALTDKDMKGLLASVGKDGLKAVTEILQAKGIPMPDIDCEDLVNEENEDAS